MVAAEERSITQHTLIQSLGGDPRLLEPGWAGDLAPDELEVLQAELSGTKSLHSNGASALGPSGGRHGRLAKARCGVTGTSGQQTLVWPGVDYPILDVEARFSGVRIKKRGVNRG